MYNGRRDGKVVGYDKELIEKTKVNGDEDCILFLNVVDRLNAYIDFYKGTKELYIGTNNLRDYYPLLAKEAYEVGRILATGYGIRHDLVKTKIDNIFDEEAKDLGITQFEYKRRLADCCEKILPNRNDVYSALVSYVMLPEDEELRRERMADREFESDPNRFKRLYR